jgi:two-component system, chemotaxis family, CheB/CheR fusion protein
MPPDLVRVLVVDDYDDISEMLATMLRRNGYEAETASSSLAAIEKCQAGAYEVVLSDIGLPVMNGYELVRKLRTLPGYKSIAMIALTGLTVFGDRKAARTAGFDEQLTKPVGERTLITTIERVLRTKR